MKAAKLEKFPDQGPGIQVVAQVEEECKEGWCVEGSELKRVARQASSCLLTPRPGDRVLLFALGAECWILAILDREPGSASVLSTAGDLTVQSSGGKVSLDGAEGVGVRSGRSISLDSPEFRLASRVAEVVTGKLSWIGQTLEARFDGVRYVGRLFESVVERFSSRARRSYRDIEEIDQVRSAHIDYRADGNMTLRARNVLAKAKELAKLDGDQIHMG